MISCVAPLMMLVARSQLRRTVSGAASNAVMQRQSDVAEKSAAITVV